MRAHVVADRANGVDGFIDVTRLQKSIQENGVRPNAGKTVGDQFEVRVGGVLLLEGLRQLKLNVVTELVRHQHSGGKVTNSLLVADLAVEDIASPHFAEGGDRQDQHTIVGAVLVFVAVHRVRRIMNIGVRTIERALASVALARHDELVSYPWLRQVVALEPVSPDRVGMLDDSHRILACGGRIELTTLV